MKTVKWGCLILVIFFAGVALLASVADSGEPEEIDTDYNAIYYAEQRIEKSLKAPSTAEFGRATVSRSGDSFTVLGFVDAQNGFGAMIRSYYKVKVTFEGENVRTEILEFE